MRNTKLLGGALAIVAIGSGISACGPSNTPAAGSKPGDAGTTSSASAAAVLGGSGSMGSSMGSSVASGSGGGISTGPGRYILSPMPAGTVWLQRDAGQLQAQVDVFGLTPGSSHQVSIEAPGGRAVQFPALNADSAGRADATLSPVDRGASLPSFGRFVIRLGDSATDPLAQEEIAESSVLPTHPLGRSAYALHPVTAEANGVNLGQPAGQAALTYNASAQTVTVTVTASGLNPGPHAAHIHLGSCRNQGPVKYMLADFVADASGNIVNQTRVVTGVTSVPGPGNWYLNLHQGGMNQILAGGAPTLDFRPMLCADIVSFATAGGTPPVSPSAAPPTSASPSGMASTPGMTMPSSTPSMTMPTTPAPTATVTSSPSGVPTTSPTSQPTHW
ncbi:MAG: CHRD domain-containing protein [Streptosporangiaceae bacterium]|nr:CHRD domain-containing protein [Streptosporangiaceae bacterium]